MHTKQVFSDILWSFGLGSGWDQLLHVLTELQASFDRQVPVLIPYVWEHAMSDIL